MIKPWWAKFSSLTPCSTPRGSWLNKIPLTHTNGFVLEIQGSCCRCPQFVFFFKCWITLSKRRHTKFPWQIRVVKSFVLCWSELAGTALASSVRPTGTVEAARHISCVKKTNKQTTKPWLHLKQGVTFKQLDHRHTVYHADRLVYHTLSKLIQINLKALLLLSDLLHLLSQQFWK